MTFEYIKFRLCRGCAKVAFLLLATSVVWLSWSADSVAADSNCSRALYGSSLTAPLNTSGGAFVTSAVAFWAAEFQTWGRFAGSPQLAGAYLGAAPFSYTIPASSKFCDVSSTDVIGIGFTPGPLGVWDASEGGWLYPFHSPSENISSFVWVFRIKPQGQKLTYEPVGVPFMQSSVASGTPSFPAYTLELELKATNTLGSDAGKNLTVAFYCDGASSCLASDGYLGSLHDYKTSDGVAGNILSKSWRLQNTVGQAIVGYKGSGTDVTVSLETSMCNLGGHTYGYWNSAITQGAPGASLTFNLPEVMASSFSGVGSVVEGGAGVKGALVSTCVKYDPEQIKMTVRVAGGVAAPGLESQGVALGNASDSVGIQLLFSDKADPMDTDLQPVDLTGTPTPLAKSFLTLGGEVRSTSYRFNNVSYHPADSLNASGGVSFRVRYYQVKPAITPHRISVTYEITQDVN